MHFLITNSVLSSLNSDHWCCWCCGCFCGCESPGSHETGHLVGDFGQNCLRQVGLRSNELSLAVTCQESVQRYKLNDISFGEASIDIQSFIVGIKYVHSFEIGIAYANDDNRNRQFGCIDDRTDCLMHIRYDAIGDD